MRGDGEMVEHEGGSPISDDAQTQSYDSLSRRPRAGSASHSSRCWSFFPLPDEQSLITGDRSRSRRRPLFGLLRLFRPKETQ